MTLSLAGKGFTLGSTLEQDYFLFAGIDYYHAHGDENDQWNNDDEVKCG